MNTILVNLRTADPADQDKAYKKAAEIIRAGGLVAFPTETVYGLGANGLNAEASAKIYAAKGRPSDNPLILHIAEISQLYEITDDVPEAALKLADACWPGPLTMIFKKKDIVPYGTTGGLDTAAVRMPDHPVARRLILESGVPIAAPSANLSGKPSPTSAERTSEDMNGRIEMILDGGPCRIGLESTIVDFTEDVPVILRPGYITLEQLKDLLGEVRMDKALTADESENIRPKAPGQKYRHYAPEAAMTLVEGCPEAVTKRMTELASEEISAGRKVGILCTAESGDIFKNLGTGDQISVKILGARNDLDQAAHNLFEFLREFDQEKVDVIYSEAFDNAALGNALMNRMIKAAGHKVIKAE